MIRRHPHLFFVVLIFVLFAIFSLNLSRTSVSAKGVESLSVNEQSSAGSRAEVSLKAVAQNQSAQAKRYSPRTLESSYSPYHNLSASKNTVGSALPTTWTVTNTNDSGSGSLREALASSAPDDIINFSLSNCPCTITLSSGSLNITNSINIIGPGADQLTLSGGIFNIDHGNGAGAVPTAVRVFFVMGGDNYISGLTIANGVAKGGNGGCGGSGGGGGAGVGGGMFIYSGAMNLKNVVFANNQAIGGKGGNGNSCVDTNTGSHNTSIRGGGGAGAFGFVGNMQITGDGDGNGGYGAGGGVGQLGGLASNGSLRGDGGNNGSRGADNFFTTGSGSPGGSPLYEGAGGGGGGRGGKSNSPIFPPNDGVGGNGGKGQVFGGGGGAGGGCPEGSGGDAGFGGGAGGSGGNGDTLGGAACSPGSGTRPGISPTDWLERGGGRGGHGNDGGGGGGGGAGFGGAIFIHNGVLRMSNSSFSGNSVQGGAGGRVATFPKPFGTTTFPEDGEQGDAAGAALYANQTAQVQICNITYTSGQDIAAFSNFGILSDNSFSVPTITTAVSVCGYSTGNTASIPAPSGSYSIQWSIRSGGIITSATNSTSITYTAVPNSGPVTITVKLTNTITGCTAEMNKDVPVTDPPSFSINLPLSICALSTGNQLTTSTPLANYSWQITGGTITAGATSQTVTYTAGASGNVQLTLSTTGASGCPFSYVLSIPTTQGASPSSSNFAPGTVGVPYTANFTGAGTLIKNSGSLPPGLTFNNGVLSGTPTQRGSYTFSLTTANGCGGVASFTLNIGCVFTVSPNILPTGQVSQAYSASFTTSGAVAPVTFAYTGSLPPGLSLSTAGVLSGTPTQSASFPITVTATDAGSCTGSVNVTIMVGCEPLIPYGLPPGLYAMPYGPITLSVPDASGVVVSYTGSLPDGLTLSSSGVLSGTVFQTGLFPITVSATSSNGCTVSRSYLLAMNESPTPFSFNPQSIPVGVIGSNYSVKFAVNAANLSQHTIPLLAGRLPSGISVISSGSGEIWIYGTPTQTGVFPITIGGTRISTREAYTSDYLLIVTCTGHAISPASVSAGTINQPYQATTLTESGGTAPYIFKLFGKLPPGMSLVNGVVSGTPTQAGTFPITILSYDANECVGAISYNLVINGCNPLTISPSIVVPGKVGQPYSTATFTQTGGIGATTFSASGTLPNGMGLSTSGILGGTPTQSGTFPITVTATDSRGCTASVSFNLLICATITLNPTFLPQGALNTAYPATTFAQTGGVGAVTFSKTGNLPNGMSFVNGVLSGTPTASGSFPITVTATDANGCTGSQTNMLTVKCATGTIQINPAELPIAYLSAPYFSGISATLPDGQVVYSGFQFTGDLPPGMFINNGFLVGTPTRPGLYPLNVTFDDGNGCVGSRDYFLLVPCGTPVTLNAQTLANGNLGAAYPATTFSVANGTAPYTFMVKGLPPGMRFVDGVLYGTPTQGGTYTLTVGVMDANSCPGTMDYTLLINACPTINVNPTSLPTGIAGAVYAGATFTQTGGTGSTTFSTGSTVPAGMSLSSGGVLSGTPTQTGTFPITVTAKDANNCTGSVNLSLQINCPTISMTPTSLPNGMVGTSYNQTISASGASSYTFMVTAGNLPTGLTLPVGPAASVNLNGQPTTSGTYNFTIKATASGGCNASQAYTVVINAPPTITAATPLSREGGKAATTSQIAVVTDADQTLTTLSVSATALTGTGITISSISIDSGGNVSASLAASCGATNSTFTLQVTDSTGLSATAILTINVTGDTQLPVITCPANISQSTDANSCAAVVNYTAPTATDNCGSPTVSCTPPSGASFAKGATTVNCTATDGATNTASCSFTVTVNDSQSPTVTCPANITKPTDANQCSAVVGFSATPNDNCPNATVVCTPASGSVFQKGTTTVTCTATDASGNTGSSTFAVTVNDTQLPVINPPANITKPTDTNLCSAVVTYTAPTATDNCGSATVSCSPQSGATFAKGTTTVTCTATDTSNNLTSCTFTVTVNDTQNPTLTCPANIVKGTDANLCAAVVTFAAQAADNCPGVSTPICTPPSGSTFAKGTTTVTCTVRDAANNQSSSCSFTVTVNDSQPPSIATLANISVPAATGQCTAPVSYAMPSVSDNCSGVGIPVCLPPSGSSFAKGTTTVTCTVKDGGNNQASSWFTVTVLDTQAPTIVCPANIISNTVNAGDATVLVNFPMPATSDNCSTVTVVCVPPSGSLFPRGTTNVNCQATDTSNNQTSCSFTVGVFDYVIVDDTNGKILRFDSLTGDYDFFDCRKGTSMSGRGVVTITTCKTELRHTGDDPRRPDRNVYAIANPCTKVGYATITYAGLMHTVNDANLSNNILRCP